MASQVQRLAQTVHSISVSTARTSQSLVGFDRDFTKHVNEVQAALLGTTSRADQEVLQALDHARKATRQAAEALARASKVCETYARNV